MSPTTTTATVTVSDGVADTGPNPATAAAVDARIGAGTGPAGGLVWMPDLFNADRRATSPQLDWLTACIPVSLLTRTHTGEK